MTQGIKTNKKSEKTGGINEQSGLHNTFLQKILTGVFFLLTPAANMPGTTRFSIGCMTWQHAVTSESICPTNSIIISFPVQGTGLLTPLLTCSPLLLIFTWTNSSKSNSLSPFYSLEKLLQVQTFLLLCSSCIENSVSNFIFTNIFPVQLFSD